MRIRHRCRYDGERPCSQSAPKGKTRCDSTTPFATKRTDHILCTSLAAAERHLTFGATCDHSEVVAVIPTYRIAISNDLVKSGEHDQHKVIYHQFPGLRVGQRYTRFACVAFRIVPTHRQKHLFIVD